MSSQSSASSIKPLQQELQRAEQTWGSGHPEVVPILYRLADTYLLYQEYEQVRAHLQRALLICENHSGPNHSDTAESLYKLGILAIQEGKSKDAIGLYERALAIYGKNPGSEHPTTANLLLALATAYQYQGRYQEAEEYLHRAGLIREQHFGTEDLQVVSTIHSLSILSAVQGRETTSEKWQELAASLQPAALLNHLMKPLLPQEQALEQKTHAALVQLFDLRAHTLSVQESLQSLVQYAAYFQRQEMPAQAERMYRSIVELCEKELDRKYPVDDWSDFDREDTEQAIVEKQEFYPLVRALHDLANFHEAHGNCHAAEPLYWRILNICEALCGWQPEADRYYRRPWSKLLELLSEWGPYEETAEAFSRFIRSLEEEDIQRHKLLAWADCRLALCACFSGSKFYALGSFHLQRALSLRVEKLGPEHPLSAATRDALATLYRRQGEHEAATELHRRARPIFQQISPIPSDLLPLSLGDQIARDIEKIDQENQRFQSLKQRMAQIASSPLQRALQEQQNNRYGSAEKIYQDILSTPQSEQERAAAEQGLAALYRRQGQYDKATKVQKSIVEKSAQEYGSESPLTASQLMMQAMNYEFDEKYDQAEEVYKRVLHIYEQTYGSGHQHLGTPLGKLAEIYIKQERYEEAYPLALRHLEIATQNGQDKQPPFAWPLGNLASIYAYQGKVAAAEELFRRVVALREQQFGPQHITTAYEQGRLADVYQRQGKYSEAEALYQNVLAVYTAPKLSKHVSIQKHIQRELPIQAQSYASLLRKMERNEEATKLEIRFNIQEKEP